jgi:hypothetical protein
MRILIRAVALGFLILPLINANSTAQSRSEQIEALKKRMEDIQRQNQQQIEELRKKIEDLEAQKEAEQKKVEELATKKEEEEKGAWWKKIEVEYKKPGDGFTLKTKDGNFKLRTRLRTQLQFSISDIDEEDTATDFNVRRLRVTWDGNAFRPWLTYTIQASADRGNFDLRDAYFDFAYTTLFVPRPGQFKVPFSREELTSSSELLLVERSIVNEEFAFGRDKGTAIYGVLGNYITYGVGVFNGDGRNGRSVDSNLLYVGRVMVTPCCGELKYGGTFPSGGDYKIEPNFGERDKPLIAIGASIAGIPGLNIGRKTPDNDIDERFDEIFGADVIKAGNARADVIAFTADANFKYWIFSLEGEYHIRRIDPEESGFEEATDQGFRAQAGLFIVPEFIEIAGRFALIDFDDDVGGRAKKWEITPGLNFYLSKDHKYKLQFSYSFIRDEDTDNNQIDENVLRAQLQVYF